MKQILGNSIKYKELIRSPLLSFRWIEQPVLKTVSGTPEHHWVALLICSIFRQFSLTPEEKSRICIALNLASTQNREVFPTALTCLASEICFSPTSESAANKPAAASDFALFPTSARERGHLWPRGPGGPKRSPDGPQKPLERAWPQGRARFRESPRCSVHPVQIHLPRLPPPHPASPHPHPRAH